MALIHDMEEQLEEDLEQFKRQHSKLPQRDQRSEQKMLQDKKKQANLKNSQDEENGTPDTINDISELKNRQNFQLYEKEEENKKKIERETQEMARHIRESVLKHRESL